MKKIVLTALNAKYFHTNLAVRCLKAAAGGEGIEIVERTINDDMDSVLEQIISHKPSAVGFSCYIWNIEHVLKLAESIKKVLPECFLFFGGPEVSFGCEEFLCVNTFADMIIFGEGELTFAEWINAYKAGKSALDIAGTAVRDGAEIRINPARDEKYDLDALPFLYNDLCEYENKIIYFETSRGCPMRCAYCMSGLTGGMSYMGIEKIEYAFEYFLKNNVRQVKLVDRTFNYPLDRAKEILAKLIDIKRRYPKAETNFHFEITASMIDDEFLDIISDAPEGLIQFEAGVQSTNPDTLKAISRGTDTQKVLVNIKKIVALKKIAVHADLIAGLPYEDYASFARSFDDVYALDADKIHLGFLKLLKGSTLRAEAVKYGIEYSNHAPYKVLKTADISYEELRSLEKIEQLVDLYYNSGNFKNSIAYVTGLRDTPFEFYDGFMRYAQGISFFKNRHAIAALFDILYDFSSKIEGADIRMLKDTLLNDWALMEKPRRYPKRIEPRRTKEYKDCVRRFYNDSSNIQKYLPDYEGHTPSAISRMCHIELYKGGKRAVLYDYAKKKNERASEIVLKEG